MTVCGILWFLVVSLFLMGGMLRTWLLLSGHTRHKLTLTKLYHFLNTFRFIHFWIGGWVKTRVHLGCIVGCHQKMLVSWLLSVAPMPRQQHWQLRPAIILSAGSEWQSQWPGKSIKWVHFTKGSWSHCCPCFFNSIVLILPPKMMVVPKYEINIISSAHKSHNDAHKSQKKSLNLWCDPLIYKLWLAAATIRIHIKKCWNIPKPHAYVQSITPKKKNGSWL